MCAQTTPKSRLPSAASLCVSATRLSQHLSKVGSFSAVQQVSGSGGGASPQGEFVSRKLFWSKSKQHVQSKCNSNDSPSACVREGNDQELEGAGMRASSIRQSFITERWTEAGVTGEGEDKSVWELAMTKSGNIRKVGLQTIMKVQAQSKLLPGRSEVVQILRTGSEDSLCHCRHAPKWADGSIKFKKLSCSYRVDTKSDSGCLGKNCNGGCSLPRHSHSHSHSHPIVLHSFHSEPCSVLFDYINS